jgi:hypothetical protein
MVECGPCPVFESFTLALALQLRKKHGKHSVRVRKTSVRLGKTSVTVQYTYYQNHPHITKPSQTHTTLTNTHMTVSVPSAIEFNPFFSLTVSAVEWLLY